MPDRFDDIFATLKSVFEPHEKNLIVTADTPKEYTLVSKTASPFPQHKGQSMYLGGVRLGKAYVSFHFMPLYMNPALTKTISLALKKRMQGKSCFNFKVIPEPEMLAELARLTDAGFQQFKDKKWL
jgi:hypothetical protein